MAVGPNVALHTPALIAAASENAGIRFLKFFRSIRNPRTRPVSGER
jgi:hypothetical protein